MDICWSAPGWLNIKICLSSLKGEMWWNIEWNEIWTLFYWLKTTFFILVMARSDYENGPAVVMDIWLVVVCLSLPPERLTGLTIMPLYCCNAGQQLWDHVSQPLNTICQSLLRHHKWHGHTDTRNWGDTTGITPRQYLVSHLLQGIAPPTQLKILYQTT